MLTIQQSSLLTGKSQKTIRRLIKRLLETDKNAGQKIQQVPFPGGFTYKIDKEYLLSHTQTPIQQDNHDHSQGQPHATQPTNQQDSQQYVSKDEYIAFLSKEIDRLHGTIKELLERDKERNVLFHKFQDALKLEAPKSRVDGDSLIVQEPNNQDRQEGSQDGQPISQATDTKHNQNETKEKPLKVKPKRKQPRNASGQFQKTERGQPKKKGFWSFLSRK